MNYKETLRQLLKTTLKIPYQIYLNNIIFYFLCSTPLTVNTQTRVTLLLLQIKETNYSKFLNNISYMYTTDSVNCFV
jgi:hypothetical protein